MSFTVVTYHTPDFRHFAAGIRSDCGRLGQAFYCQETATNFENLIHAFDHKIGFLMRMVRTHGQVLWLDVECRLVSQVPADWSSPLITSYEMGTHHGLSSGVLMLGEEDLPFLDKWNKYAKKYPRSPDDFVLDFLTQALDYSITTVPLEFYDRSKPALVVRGQWQNEATIVQHPTINRWPNPIKYRRAFIGSQQDKRRAESVSRQRKHIFFRNFGGDFERVFQIMESGASDPQVYSDWVFDSKHWTYAPEFYWPTIKDDFNVKPLTFEKSVSHFNEQPNNNRYRDVAIGRMRLDSSDGGKRGLFSMLTNWNS